MIISRIKGGIGNQLFIYAASKRLALKNNVELVLDTVSGFKYDKDFQRHYQLDHFNISARKATAIERLEPFSRIRRYIKRNLNRKFSFDKRSFIEEEGLNFEAQLPNVLPEDSRADLGLFLDFGNVWGVDYDSTIDDSNKIRSSTGVVVNWSSPIGPMSFTLAQNLSKAKELKDIIIIG